MKLLDKMQQNDIFRSVFRHGLPTSRKEEMEMVSDNFFLHLQSAKVHLNSLRFGYSLGLGLISLYLFIILTITGVLLMFYYVPSTKEAYGNIKDLEFVVTYGMLLRTAHRWAAHMMVASVVMHLCRVFYTASYKKPREFNWVIGVVLLLLTLFLSFTGYLLPWDQLAFWAITVGANIASYAPIIGDTTREILLGGTIVGQAALIRFYVLHVMVLPIVMSVLIGVHFWRIRKDGGLSRPADEDTPTVEAGVPAKDSKPADSVPVSKTYGLMTLVKKSGIRSANQKIDNFVPSWPNLIIREVVLFVLVVGVIWALSIVFPAPLEEAANPISPPNPAKAPWYFLGLQELVSYSALLGGVVIPGLMVGLLIVLPYIDRKTVGIGVWCHKARFAGVSLFTLLLIINIILIIIGTFFRGPNWDMYMPWDLPAAGGH